jgi:GNAT superfamily N-acetyltransferase
VKRPAARGGIRIRPCREGDREFVLATAARLSDFGPPAWRSAAEIVEGESRTLRAHLDTASGGARLLVAEDDDGTPLGFVFLERASDYFSGREHGHVGILAVSAQAEGRGAGTALMRAAESWAAAQGYARLTLNVFDGNDRARAMYERLGYAAETLRYVKILRPGGG